MLRNLLSKGRKSICARIGEEWLYLNVSCNISIFFYLAGEFLGFNHIMVSPVNHWVDFFFSVFLQKGPWQEWRLLVISELEVKQPSPGRCGAGRGLPCWAQFASSSCSIWELGSGGRKCMNVINLSALNNVWPNMLL